MTIDQFVAKFGPPVGEWTKQDGHKIYRFARGQDEVPVFIPGTVNTTTSVYGGPAYTTGTSTPGGVYNIPRDCGLLVEIDKGNSIVNIEVEKDTIGMWEMSRCGEVFG